LFLVPMIFKGRNINYTIYLASLLVLAVGLPLSHSLMSIAQFILLGNWLIEGNLKQKIISFFNNSPALIISGLFLIHFLGLSYSDDLNYGFEDVRKKIPLLLLPLILSTSQKLGNNDLWLILKSFIAAVFLSSVICFAVYLGFSGKEITDVRQISIFISHIRFSLMIALSVLFSLKLIKASSTPGAIMYSLLIIWLILFLIILESLTGLLILVAAAFLLSALSLKRLPERVRVLGFAVLLSAFLLPAIFILREIQDFYAIETIVPEQLDKFSSKGEQYVHELNSKEVENGKYVRIYIAREELMHAWNTRSLVHFESLDKKGHYIEYTIYRYLTSKGLRKDADGLAALSPQEIQDIESGIANVDFKKSGLHDRIRKVIWEIDRYFKDFNPSGHSVSMRLEFWKTAIGIIKENVLIGVGTGDVRKAFEAEYINNKTQLDKEYRHRSHNQFLAIATALGLLGLLYFIFSLVIPFKGNHNSKSFLYKAFFIVAILSMLTEDTLETQAGVTFFAFFNCLLLFARNPQSEE
jgi:hypothetical protein